MFEEVCLTVLNFPFSYFLVHHTFFCFFFFDLYPKLRLKLYDGLFFSHWYLMAIYSTFGQNFFEPSLTYLQSVHPWKTLVFLWMQLGLVFNVIFQLEINYVICFHVYRFLHKGNHSLFLISLMLSVYFKSLPREWCYFFSTRENPKRIRVFHCSENVSSSTIEFY